MNAAAVPPKLEMELVLDSSSETLALAHEPVIPLNRVTAYGGEPPSHVTSSLACTTCPASMTEGVIPKEGVLTGPSAPVITSDALLNSVVPFDANS